MMNCGSRNTNGGFTLIELLVAFSLLLVGMTGIISMFAAGMRLERAGTLAFDGAVVLDELRPVVIKKLREQAKDGAGGELGIPTTEIPDRPGLSYSARAVPIPETAAGQGYLLNIYVIPAGSTLEDAFSFGWLPVRLRPEFEELVGTARNEPESSSTGDGVPR